MHRLLGRFNFGLHVRNYLLGFRRSQTSVNEVVLHVDNYYNLIHMAISRILVSYVLHLFARS